jgi:hypothetical protein
MAAASLKLAHALRRHSLNVWPVIRKNRHAIAIMLLKSFVFIAV